MSYNIVLPKFEGPFDLLLFFIERDELDIYDIPIHVLTKDFLTYVQQMERLNIELASEFILVAATLMRIKAKTLLPRKELDALGNEIDPREELVNRLLEYKKYKNVVDVLKRLESDRSCRENRGNIESELKYIAQNIATSGEAELENVTLFKLMKVFKKVMDRYKDQNTQVQHTIVRYNYTLEGQKLYIREFIQSAKKASFSDIFKICENKIHAVFNFLAILEMVSIGQITIKIGEGTNNFYLSEI